MILPFFNSYELSLFGSFFVGLILMYLHVLYRMIWGSLELLVRADLAILERPGGLDLPILD